MTVLTRCVLSELLSIADVCQNDPTLPKAAKDRISETVLHRVAHLANGKKPWKLSDGHLLLLMDKLGFQPGAGPSKQ